MSTWLSVVRFVPDPAKGEFINVAAIAGNEESEEVEVRAVSNWSRAKRLDEHNTLAAVMDFISTVQDRATDDSISKEYISRLSEEMSNVVQIGSPVPVVASSLSKALDLAFNELIVDPTSTRTYPFAKKHGALKSVKAAYRAHDINPKRDPQVRAGRAGAYSTNFDFVVANGKAVQLVRCWSFQLPNQDELEEQLLAWTWAVRAMRQEGGGTATPKDETQGILVTEDVAVEAVFIPPLPNQISTAAYKAALAACEDKDTKIGLVEAEQAEKVAQHAVELLDSSRLNH
ncbi:MAG: DUF3037 domain-containing protein [Polyangia bacterium]